MGVWVRSEGHCRAMVGYELEVKGGPWVGREALEVGAVGWE